MTTAEIAVAFAGFASLVGVLLQRRDLDIQRHVVNPLRVMLDYSLIALFSCLIPFLPMIAGASDATVWRLSSGIWVAGALVYSFINRAWMRRIRQDPMYSPFVSYLVQALDFASLIALFVNALDVFWQPSFLVYFGVQLWFIGGAAIGFVAVVSSIWRDPAA